MSESERERKRAPRASAKLVSSPRSRFRLSLSLSFSVCSLWLLLTPLASFAQNGRTLYITHCLRCHGTTDDKMVGDWRADNFRTATYKFRSSASGEVPTDKDLLQTISEGVQGWGMPAFKTILIEPDQRSIVDYLKSLDVRFKSKPLEVEIPKTPSSSPETIAEGKALFDSSGCTLCHGKEGKGDGPLAKSLSDDFGKKAMPTNLSGNLKHGHSASEIYKTLLTGLNGTPMAAFDDAVMTPTQRWALAHYVYSLKK